ncbi:MAG TPA: retropepsin-like aspartic protease [Candidatus Xenobia bacterium]|nr:retropepsin-like aspartic protease [Candidatus Xenobia bacterium]
MTKTFSGLLSFGILLALSSLSATAQTVPFEVDGKRNSLLVEVVVDGKPCTFVLDTGAGRTVVSPAVLRGLAEFNLKVSKFNPKGPGLAGEATWETVNSLRLGKETWYDRRVVVMNLEAVSKVYDRRIDGLLGLDLLREFDSVLIDFKNRTITLSQ